MKVLRTKLSILIVLVIAILFTYSSEALAYYNRGKVSLSLGSNNISLQTGSSSSVSISMDPKSRTGNQGCGMAKCPQECGGMCGDEKTGECLCNGDALITQKAIATVESSNSFVAKVKYNKSTNVITVTGLNQGTAKITVKGTLWQYTDSDPQTISVTVKGSESNSSPESNKSSTSSKSSGEVITRSIPNSNNSTNEKNNSTNNDSNTTSEEDNKDKNNNSGEDKDSNEKKESEEAVNVKGKLGSFTILPIASGRMGKAELEKIKGKDETVTFQKKNESGNVLYSWSFKGSDIKTPENVDMNIEFPEISTIDSKIAGKLKNPYLISFIHSGELPGKATIYTETGDKYKNNTKLSLYYYNEDSNELELINENVNVDRGFVSFDIEHCSKYILTEGINESSVSINYIYIILGAFALVVIGLVSAFIYRKKSYNRLIFQVPVLGGKND